ncbi:MAG: hypothetical protein ACXAEU_00760 [Candidatus Hodarchaeales archaeon]|jgi:hypothetical protein
MKKSEIFSIIIEFIHSTTGWGNPLRPHCELEDLVLKEIKKSPNGNFSVEFEYRFDEDSFSQYDKTHVLEGRVTIDTGGRIIEKALEETHRGVAAIKEHEPKESS